MTKINVNEVELNGEIYVKKNAINQPAEQLDGLEYCIVRTYSAGVFAGYWDRRGGPKKKGTVKKARRIWYWEGAASISQLATEGTSKPENCKFSVEAEHDLTEVIEVTPCTLSAQKSIAGVALWKK